MNLPKRSYFIGSVILTSLAGAFVGKLVSMFPEFVRYSASWTICILGAIVLSVLLMFGIRRRVGEEMTQRVEAISHDQETDTISPPSTSGSTPRRPPEGPAPAKPGSAPR